MPGSDSSSVIMVSPPEMEQAEAAQTSALESLGVKIAENLKETDGQEKADDAPASEVKVKPENAATKSEGQDPEDDSCDEDDDEDDDEQPKEKIIVGLIADTKSLYQKYDKHGCLIWTDQYPDDLEEAAENEETLKYAVITRFSKSFPSTHL
jgi:hypothetical protein